MVFCSSCSNNRNDPESVKKSWEAKGWTYVETFGPSVPDAVYVFYFDGGTAIKATAGITVNGVKKEKDYVQDDATYLIVGFQSPKTGDGFDMIFKKKK